MQGLFKKEILVFHIKISRATSPAYFNRLYDRNSLSRRPQNGRKRNL